MTSPSEAPSHKDALYSAVCQRYFLALRELAMKQAMARPTVADQVIAKIDAVYVADSAYGPWRLPYRVAGALVRRANHLLQNAARRRSVDPFVRDTEQFPDDCVRTWASLFKKQQLETTLVEGLEHLERECGAAYIVLLARDLDALARGTQATFTHCEARIRHPLAAIQRAEAGVDEPCDLTSYAIPAALRSRRPWPRAYSLRTRLRRHGRRLLHSPSLWSRLRGSSGAAVRRVQALVAENPPLTAEDLWSFLLERVPAYGGDRARARIELEVRALKYAVLGPLYQAIIDRVGNQPDAIVRWVRRRCVHVDRHPISVPSEANRPLRPAETLFLGVGQCVSFANLAACMARQAGWEARCWDVEGHAFLEIRRAFGRWQLEDVDVLPPGSRLPRGLSMLSLLESYSHWVPVLEAIPRYNSRPLAHCFAPQGPQGRLLQRPWYQRAHGFSPQRTFDLGSFRTETYPRLSELSPLEDRRGYRLRLEIDDGYTWVVTACLSRTPFPSPRTIGGEQHDIFHAAGIEENLTQARSQCEARIEGQVDREYPCLELRPGTPGALYLCVLVHRLDLPTAFPFPIVHSLPIRVEADPHCKSETAARSQPLELRSAWHEPSEPVLPAGADVLHVGHSKTGCQAFASAAHSLCSLPLELESLAPSPGRFDLIYGEYATDPPSSLELLRALRRLLKPGGRLLVRACSDAWYLHLREGGEAAARDALYNSAWRRYGERLGPIFARHRFEWRRSLRKFRLHDPARLGTSNLERKLECYDWLLDQLPLRDRRQVRAFELEARTWCGEAHLATLLEDLLALGAELRGRHTSSNSLHAWRPEELGALGKRAGFEDFEWGPFGTPQCAMGSNPLDFGPRTTSKMQGPDPRYHYRGALTVWEGTLRDRDE